MIDASDNHLGPVLQFMRLLWATDHGLQSVSKSMAVRLGVTGPQRLVVRILGRHPGLSAGELARVMHVHPSTLTGVLQRLEQRALIERKTDPVDQRRALFRLTAGGRAVDAQRTGTVESCVRKALGRVSASQVEAARIVLEAVAAELSASLEKTPRIPARRRRPAAR